MVILAFEAHPGRFRARRALFYRRCEPPPVYALRLRLLSTRLASSGRCHGSVFAQWLLLGGDKLGRPQPPLGWSSVS